ncbi:hypothetical protein [Planktomarina temperata]|uniref:hypothetical protein n=1 Tax=Planktomarina temperata TaxID=1284658 RepID=UPI001DFDD7EE|nr:hypothetical protein [Planktomarina temperata]
MKYGVIIALALAIGGCQRAVPTDVIRSGNQMATETAPGATQEAPPVSRISNEQDFEVVATAQTVESDAERIAANRARYIVMDVQALPRRPGRRPNVVDYALRTNNPIGVQLYNRFGTGLKVISFGGCDRYRSKDEAQQDFLAKGGPERDAYGLDPDGDGFACGWDPRPFRLAVAN